VQHRRGDHVIGKRRAREQRRHLEWMEQERSTIAVAPLLTVPIAGEGHGLTRQRQVAKECELRDDWHRREGIGYSQRPGR
jgi:hypothetical protein